MLHNRKITDSTLYPQILNTTLLLQDVDLYTALLRPPCYNNKSILNVRIISNNFQSQIY